MRLSGYFITLASGVLFGLLISAYGIRTHKDTINELRNQVTELQQDLAYYDSELQRDDAIFMSIFGDDWNRSKPMYRTQVKVTAYSSRVEETDDSPHLTSSNVYVRRGIVALSQDLRAVGIEDGDVVFLSGYGLLYVEDDMNPRKRKQVDVWMADTKAALLHGVRTATLIWFGKGDSYVAPRG